MAWLPLAQVESWLKSRNSGSRLLAAGWLDLDHVLAEALKSGRVVARGWQIASLLPVRIEDATDVSVSILLQRVTVESTRGAAGFMAASRQSREYQNVEIDAEAFGAWCVSVLGEPPSTGGVLGKSAAGQNPSVAGTAKRDRAARLFAMLFPEGYPEGMTQKSIVDAVAEALEAEESADPRLISVSTDTIRRALGFKI